MSLCCYRACCTRQKFLSYILLYLYRACSAVFGFVFLWRCLCEPPQSGPKSAKERWDCAQQIYFITPKKTMAMFEPIQAGLYGRRFSVDDGDHILDQGPSAHSLNETMM